MKAMAELVLNNFASAIIHSAVFPQYPVRGVEEAIRFHLRPSAEANRMASSRPAGFPYGKLRPIPACRLFLLPPCQSLCEIRRCRAFESGLVDVQRRLSYGSNPVSKGALMAEEIDALFRQKTGGKKRLRDSFPR